jgi:hypothetical protein
MQLVPERVESCVINVKDKTPWESRGEGDKAMAWLERSVDSGFACWPFFLVDPHLESLRGEAEFKRLVADLERP